MKKFKLIKEYPGSPKLGTEVERTSKSYKNYSYSEGNGRVCVISEHCEDNPEYWEEVNENLWYVVFEEDYDVFLSWYPYCLETCAEYKNRFKTREEADEFILLNKPCLSLNDIKKRISNLYTLESLISLVKLKI